MASSHKNRSAAEPLSLVFALLLVLFIAFLSYRASDAYQRWNQEETITRQLVVGTNDLLSSLKDAETGQRGFLLTGQDRYLEPYQKALAEIPGTLNSLTQIEPTRVPLQAQRLEALKPLVQSKLDELRQTIEIRRNQGADAALAVVLSDRGRTTMDTIRGLCSQLQAASNDLLRRQREASRTSGTQLGIISTLGSVALFIVILLSAVAIRQATLRRERLIQDLQRSEQQAAEARDWLQTTLGSIGDAVIATDAGGRITLLNAVAQALTGWTQEQAAGMPLEQVFVISDEKTGATSENPVSKVLREGRVVGLANHTRLTAKDGRRLPIDDSAAPIRDTSGNISGVVLVFRDVTVRKEAEQAFQRSMEQFQLMADHAPVLVWTAGTDKLSTWFNKPWLNFVGRTMEEEVGKAWTQDVHPEDAGRCLETYRSAFDVREPFTTEYRLRKHDGQYRWVLANGVPLHAADSSFTGYIGSNIDITERKKIEQELRRANEDLSQFAFAASHDLQEPLRMITSYAQLLVRGYRGQLDDEASVCVNFITEGTERMRALLADLLAYTQVGAEGLSFAVVDLNLIVQKTKENLKAAIEDSKAVITSDPLPTVSGQEGHFLQLFQNLIGNAIKYRGEDPPLIRIGVAKTDSDWRFAVADNGIGIDPEYHQKIFGVFKRLHGRSIPGTGIGLALCLRVVERQGGRIWVESQVNRGATFYFTLPIARGGVA